MRIKRVVYVLFLCGAGAALGMLLFQSQAAHGIWQAITTSELATTALYLVGIYGLRQLLIDAIAEGITKATKKKESL